MRKFVAEGARVMIADVNIALAEQLAAGTVDVIIGTHRLLAADPIVSTAISNSIVFIVLAGNGYLLFQGVDLIDEARSRLLGLSTEFWLDLAIEFAKVIGIFIAAGMVARWIRKLLDVLARRAKVYKNLTANDASIETFFTSLNRIQKTAIWLLAAYFAVSILPFAPGAGDMLLLLLRVYLIIDVGTALPEESHARNVIDRVTAASTAFLGLTAQCAVCHDHKFDPISTREYYSMYAFFHSAADPAIHLDLAEACLDLGGACDRLPNRPRRIDTRVHQERVERLVGDREPEAVAFQALAQPAQLDHGDLADLLAVQRVEHHHLVHAVDELGPEVLADDLHHGRLHGFVALFRQRLDALRAEVRSHHHHRVAEVHGAALAVGQAAVVQKLQQDIKHL